ncbi:MAG: transposase [Vicinamibacterales bacterium]
MLQVAIEAEATAFLGREHYRRGARQRVGWRNGYEPKHVQTEAGVLELAMPQLRGTDEPFRPRVAERLQPGPRISRAWCGGCTSAACRRRTSARSSPTRSAAAG